jgi:hypothetical protein
MYRNHTVHKTSYEHLRNPFLGSGNSLGIGNPNFLWDQRNSRLILTMESNQIIDRDIRAHVKGNSLLLEAPLLSSYNKPFRTHHLGKKYTEEYEDALTLIGFSEIKLKHGYKYRLISCQVFDTNMIEVVLGFTLWGRNGNN